MKNWWPGRKKKPRSLFEGSVPSTRWSVGRERPVPITAPDTPHHMNAPGPFYVVNRDCMTCGYPHVLAPDLMAWEMNSEGREFHCYFRKQPKTPQEIEQAVNAVKGSCCGALRYCGSDPAIIQKFKDAGCKESIDH